jgi:hypothetical protein
MLMQSLREPESSGSSSPAGERRVTETIKRELRNRSAVEPGVGHLKIGHGMGRNIECKNVRLFGPILQSPC